MEKIQKGTLTESKLGCYSDSFLGDITNDLSFEVILSKFIMRIFNYEDDIIMWEIFVRGTHSILGTGLTD